MTPRKALLNACIDVRRYRYIPDTVTVDDMTIPVDVWDTLQEFEARKGGDCFPLDQRIICRDRDGLYALPTLGELRTTYTDYEALSYDFEARKWSFRRVLAWQSKGVRPVVEARMMNGSRFRVTPDHRVWVRWGSHDERGNGGARRLIEQPIGAIDLKHSYARQMIVAGQIPALATPYDPTLAYLDGVYAAEGYIKERGKRAVCIAQDTPAIREKIEHSLNALGINYRPSKRAVHAYYTIKGDDADHFRPLGTHSRDKRLTIEALSSYPEVVERLVEGHRDGDGYVPMPGTHHARYEVIHATSSDELKRHLVLANLILGKHVNRCLQGNHMGAGKHPIWRLSVAAPHVRRRLLPDYEGLGLNGLKSLSPSGECEVADITVEGTHNFVLDDGVLVHNCDGYVSWAIERAFRQGSSGAFYFVVGEVLQRSGVWAGHAWVELIEDGVCWWADPTWGEGPQSKESLGYPSKRRPRNRWRYTGDGHFDQEEVYL